VLPSAVRSRLTALSTISKRDRLPVSTMLPRMSLPSMRLESPTSC
jgi:hypothetical protein